MESFPDCGCPGWGEDGTSLRGRGPQAASPDWGQTPEGLSRWDCLQEVRVIDAHGTAEQSELGHAQVTHLLKFTRAGARVMGHRSVPRGRVMCLPGV